MKICQVYNDASHYRESVYRLIDETFDSDFIFGKASDDIKQMDTRALRGNVVFVENYFFDAFYWQSGVIRRALKQYDAYILLGDAHCLSMWVLCIILRVFFPKREIYMWTHGWYGKESGIDKLIKKCFYRLANGGIFLYGNHAKELMAKEGFDSMKLHVIHNSLDYDAQLPLRQSLQQSKLFQKHFGNENKNIIFIGRLTQVKRFDLLINAVEELKKRGEKVNVTFIGDGVERQNMGRMVVEKGIKDQVWFYGACYDERTNAELIYNADLCVSPGNIGLTAMHVMMFGCPAITNDDFNHQMPEFEAIKEGKTGSFFKAGDSSTLADVISKWFENHGRDREQVRQNCYDVIDKGWNPHIQMEIINDVLNKRRDAHTHF